MIRDGDLPHPLPASHRPFNTSTFGLRGREDAQKSPVDRQNAATYALQHLGKGPHGQICASNTAKNPQMTVLSGITARPRCTFHRAKEQTGGITRQAFREVCAASGSDLPGRGTFRATGGANLQAGGISPQASGSETELRGRSRPAGGRPTKCPQPVPGRATEERAGGTPAVPGDSRPELTLLAAVPAGGPTVPAPRRPDAGADSRCRRCPA